MKEETIDKNKRHFVVDAVIKKENKYFMIDRQDFPFGWACVSGHIEKNETPEEALKREIKEEVNLDVTSAKLISEEFLPEETCHYGITGHVHFTFEVKVTGKEMDNKNEVKFHGWFDKEELKTLDLQPEWDFLLRKLNIL